MAAWSDMSDDAYDVAESYAQHVTPHSFYAEWDGALDDAMTTACLLRVALDAETEAATGLHEALVEINEILDRAAAA